MGFLKGVDCDICSFYSCSPFLFSLDGFFLLVFSVALVMESSFFYDCRDDEDERDIRSVRAAIYLYSIYFIFQVNTC